MCGVVYADVTASIVGVSGLLLAVVSAFTAAYFFGGRRWRDNTDAEKEAHRQTKESLAARDATILEKDQAISGMSDRLRRLDEVVSELGGVRVAQQLADMNRETLHLFEQLTSILASHESASRDRERELVTELRTISRQLATICGPGEPSDSHPNV